MGLVYLPTFTIKINHSCSVNMQSSYGSVMGKVIYRGPITPCIRISSDRPPCKFMVDTDKRWQESWAKKTPWCKTPIEKTPSWKVTWITCFKKKLGGGFNYFFSPRSLGKWSTLTSKFFKWVGVQPPRKPIIVDFGYLFILLNSCGVNVCEIFHKKIPKLSWAMKRSLSVKVGDESLLRYVEITIN